VRRIRELSTELGVLHDQWMALTPLAQEHSSRAEINNRVVSYVLLMVVDLAPDQAVRRHKMQVITTYDRVHAGEERQMAQHRTQHISVSAYRFQRP